MSPRVIDLRAAQLTETALPLTVRIDPPPPLETRIQAVKLVKQIDGKAGQGAKGGKYSTAGRTYRGGPSPKSAAGVVIDGDVYPLAGEPPVAVSHGWGDLTWLYRPKG